MSATPTPTPTFLEFSDVRLILFILVVAAIAIAIERVIATYLSRFAKRARLQPHTTNNLVLITRILILLFAVATIANIGGLPPEWILSISAIGGAALGFSSQKTLGNFLAGLFLLSARPFKVGDYVRIGAVEGIVQEITINYTKVFTPANNTVSISNLQILDRDVTNFSLDIERTSKSQSLYCYTFEIGFDHAVSAERIGQIFDEVFNKSIGEFSKKPTYSLIRSGGTERVYMVYLYVHKPEDILKLRPQISEEVFRMWDEQRLQKR